MTNRPRHGTLRHSSRGGRARPTHRTWLGLLNAGLLAAIACASASDTPTTPTADLSTWTPVWADEFDRDGLPDPARWVQEVGAHGWGNRELQLYTRDRRENARVEGGRLIIEARRDAYEGHEYTSARLNSVDAWRYSRIEVRAKLPSGRGTWPAIWMLHEALLNGGASWPDSGEIDIMEHVGHDPDVVHASIHTKAFNHVLGTQKTASIRVAGARDDFHVYAIEWTATSIRALVDGREYFRFDKPAGATVAEWPFDEPFRLLLNLAVGGAWGGAEGVDETIWPQRLEIDYVRVYQKPLADSRRR